MHNYGGMDRRAVLGEVPQSAIPVHAFILNVYSDHIHQNDVADMIIKLLIMS